MNTRSGANQYKDRVVEVLRAMAGLLDDVPHVMFCAKDRAGTYLVVNQAFADRAAVRDPSGVVGKHASDLFEADLAASYTRQDAELWSSREPLRNQLELITRTDGSLGWYVTTKVLVTESDGMEFLASLSVDLRAAGDGPTAHAGVATAVDYARRHCTEQVRVGDVAAVAGMSVVQLERTIRRISQHHQNARTRNRACDIPGSARRPQVAHARLAHRLRLTRIPEQRVVRLPICDQSLAALTQ